jgi:hypothetical protein
MYWEKLSRSVWLRPASYHFRARRAQFYRQLSNSDMARIGRESMLPDGLDQYPDEEYTSAQHPPPRLVSAATATTPLLGEREVSPHPSFEEPTFHRVAEHFWMVQTLKLGSNLYD